VRFDPALDKRYLLDRGDDFLGGLFQYEILCFAFFLFFSFRQLVDRLRMLDGDGAGVRGAVAFEGGVEISSCLEVGFEFGEYPVVEGGGSGNEDKVALLGDFLIIKEGFNTKMLGIKVEMLGLSSGDKNVLSFDSFCISKVLHRVKTRSVLRMRRPITPAPIMPILTF
jgi:hypothetical protein